MSKFERLVDMIAKNKDLFIDELDANYISFYDQYGKCGRGVRTTINNN